jgi:uncharacterized protein
MPFPTGALLMNPSLPHQPDGLPPGPLQWRSEGILLWIAFFLPTLMAWLYFDQFAGLSGWMLALYFLTKLVMVAIALTPLCMTWRLTGRLPRFPIRSFQGVGWGLLFGLAVVGGMLALYYAALQGSPVLTQAPAAIEKRIRGFGVSSPQHFLVMALIISMLHAALEEYFWRWFVFGQLRRTMPWTAALVVAAVGFTLHHVIIIHMFVPSWPWTLLLSFAVMVGGGVWAWIYHKSGSLVGPWVSHMLIDFGLMWIGYDLCRGMWT